ARDPRGGDRRAAQSRRQAGLGRPVRHVGRARPGADRQGRRRARRRSGGRHRDAHAQRLLQPRQLARSVSARHHRAGHVEPAPVGARRPAGNGAAREGRQDAGLDRRSRHEEGRAARRHGRDARRGPDRSDRPRRRRPRRHGRRAQPHPWSTGEGPTGEAVNRFNLSEWALGHRSFVVYLMLAFVVAGVLSYRTLGREEDPAFTIKSMIVQANWPGATVEDVTNQVTDRIERKLQELPSLDFTKSYSAPGQTTIFVNLKDSTPGRDIPAIWVQVRNKINDIRAELPQGVQGPFFNDQFGDVFGNIYAFTSDGLSFRQLRDYAERARTEILKLPAAGRVELLGTQDEVIYLDFSTQHVAGLGLDQQAVLQSLQAQNAVAPSGVIQAGPQRVSLRVSGQFRSEESLRS